MRLSEKYIRSLSRETRDVIDGPYAGRLTGYGNISSYYDLLTFSFVKFIICSASSTKRGPQKKSDLFAVLSQQAFSLFQSLCLSASATLCIFFQLVQDRP